MRSSRNASLGPAPRMGATPPPLPGPREAISPGIDARILDAGEQCIRRLGLERFSMADVANQAGVSRGSVYRYFPDRDRLTHAVIERTAKRFVRSSEPAIRRRRTLAAQVAEAAVFIRQHLRDEVLTLYLPSPNETLFATLLTARMDELLGDWIEFWQP